MIVGQGSQQKEAGALAGALSKRIEENVARFAAGKEAHKGHQRRSEILIASRRKT